MVFTPPEVRKQGKRSINPTHPNTGQERQWSSSRKPEKRFCARGGGMEKWGEKCGRTEGGLTKERRRDEDSLEDT